MSHEIVYAREFMKTSDSRIIPLVLSGSNNCWEPTYGKHWRRCRSWFPLLIKSGENPAIEPEKLMERVSSCIPSTYQQHFVRNGKWVDDAAFVRFFENGIKKAKTLEELKDECLSSTSLEGTIYYYDDADNICTLHSARIADSAELDTFLMEADGYLKSETSHQLRVQLGFCSEDVLKRYPRPRTVRQKPPQYYVVTTGHGYVSRLTRRGVYSTCCCEYAKWFENEKNALKWIKDRSLEIRFPRLQFGVECVA